MKIFNEEHHVSFLVFVFEFKLELGVVQSDVELFLLSFGRDVKMFDLD